MTETRLLFCETCGRIIKDDAEDNAVFGEYPYPFDNGLGLCNKCSEFRSQNKKLSYDERMKQVREILTTMTAKRIDGTLVDAFTASAIVSVYDNLSEENQRKFAELNARKMSETAWKLVAKSKGK